MSRRVSQRLLSSQPQRRSKGKRKGGRPPRVPVPQTAGGDGIRNKFGKFFSNLYYAHPVDHVLG